ncbi:hypothetical protein F4780DRAFT_430756 [Xylariomycetidae sp. FL0641]|nr:hypothetical protein F4780DRAFT_430756 [Xylariomycetidae sp. FL0641]
MSGMVKDKVLDGRCSAGRWLASREAEMPFNTAGAEEGAGPSALTGLRFPCVGGPRTHDYVLCWHGLGIDFAATAAGAGNGHSDRPIDQQAMPFPAHIRCFANSQRTTPQTGHLRYWSPIRYRMDRDAAQVAAPAHPASLDRWQVSFNPGKTDNKADGREDSLVSGCRSARLPRPSHSARCLLVSGLTAFTTVRYVHMHASVGVWIG